MGNSGKDRGDCLLVASGKAREDCEGAGGGQRGGVNCAPLRVVSALLLVAELGLSSCPAETRDVTQEDTACCGHLVPQVGNPMLFLVSPS